MNDVERAQKNLDAAVVYQNSVLKCDKGIKELITLGLFALIFALFMVWKKEHIYEAYDNYQSDRSDRGHESPLLHDDF